MSPLDAVVYLADGLEPGRDFPDRAAARRARLPRPRRGDARACSLVDRVPASRAVSRSRRKRWPPRALRHRPARWRRDTLPELDLVALVRDAAEDKKGEDIAVLDLTGRTIVADAFVIVTGRSTIQTRSIADAIVDKARGGRAAAAAGGPRRRRLDPDRSGPRRRARVHARAAAVLQPRAALGARRRSCARRPSEDAASRSRRAAPRGTSWSRPSCGSCWRSSCSPRSASRSSSAVAARHVATSRPRPGTFARRTTTDETPAALAALAALTIAVAATVAPAFAARSSYVIDDAHLLSPAAIAQINQQVGDFNAQTGKEVVVVTTPSLDGTHPTPRSSAASRRTQVNGVEIFIAKNEKQINDRRRPRVARSSSRSGSFNPISAGDAPVFAQGNFDRASRPRVGLIVNTYRGHESSLNAARRSPSVPTSPSSVQRSQSGGFNMGCIWWIIILAVIFFIIRGIFRAMAGPRMYGRARLRSGPGYGAGGYGPGRATAAGTAAAGRRRLLERPARRPRRRVARQRALRRPRQLRRRRRRGRRRLVGRHRRRSRRSRRTRAAGRATPAKSTRRTSAAAAGVIPAAAISAVAAVGRCGGWRRRRLGRRLVAEPPQDATASGPGARACRAMAGGRRRGSAPRGARSLARAGAAVRRAAVEAPACGAAGRPARSRRGARRGPAARPRRRRPAGDRTGWASARRAARPCSAGKPCASRRRARCASFVFGNVFARYAYIARALARASGVCTSGRAARDGTRSARATVLGIFLRPGLSERLDEPGVVDDRRIVRPALAIRAAERVDLRARRDRAVLERAEVLVGGRVGDRHGRRAGDRLRRKRESEHYGIRSIGGIVPGEAAAGPTLTNSARKMERAAFLSVPEALRCSAPRSRRGGTRPGAKRSLGRDPFAAEQRLRRRAARRGGDRPGQTAAGSGALVARAFRWRAPSSCRSRWPCSSRVDRGRNGSTARSLTARATSRATAPLPACSRMAERYGRRSCARRRSSRATTPRRTCYCALSAVRPPSRRICARLGDPVTRLDRTEPALNEATPGDPRDTTTPARDGGTCSRLVRESVLSPASKARLFGWMRAAKTGATRIRAGVPASAGPSATRQEPRTPAATTSRSCGRRTARRSSSRSTSPR